MSLSLEEYEQIKQKQKKFLSKIPPFSGKTYAELNDIYPIDKRINDDLWRMVCLCGPAYKLLMQKFSQELDGRTLRFVNFQMLCWMQRCEEAKQGLAFSMGPVANGIQLFNKSLLAMRNSELMVLGLVEQITTQKPYIFRVTARGKMMIKTYVEMMRELEGKLSEWIEKTTDGGYDAFTKAMIDNLDRWHKPKNK